MSEPTLAALLAGVAATLALCAVGLSRRPATFLLVDRPAKSGEVDRRARPKRRLDHAPWFRSRRAARQRHAIEAEIPQLLDLLAAGSSAGLSAPLALRRAGEALRGPLGRELGTVFDSVDLGARWREELLALAGQWRSSDLRRAMSVLVRTETLGSSLADSTRDLASSVRQARRAAANERARTAPVKMLFPLVFLVLPAFLLLTVVPVLLTTVRSIA